MYVRICKKLDSYEDDKKTGNKSQETTGSYYT